MSILHGTLIVVYFAVCVFLIALKKLENTLEKMQYKCSKFLRQKWKKGIVTFMAKCCIMSSVLYSNPNAFVKLKCFEKVTPIVAEAYLGEERTFGYVARCLTDIPFSVIAIRSTVCLSDMLCTYDKSPVYTEYGGFHGGYYNQAANIYSVLPKINGTVLITGHSFGGSVGIALGLILSRDKSNDVHVYTFGSPKTGDEFFCFGIKSVKNLHIHNIVNSHDRICSLPKSYSRVGNTHVKKADTGSIVKNHSIYTYLNILNNSASELNFKNSIREKVAMKFIDYCL
jgi:nucleoside diphosphate kinase